MIGDGATLLAKEGASHLALGVLKPYSDELVRSVLLEVRQVDGHIASIAVPEPEAGLAAQLLAHHHCLVRCKRALLVYHDVRMRMLKHSVWHPSPSSAANANASPAEAAFAKDYARLVTAYKDEFLDILDVTGPLGPPPTDLMCTVEALRDARDVVTDSGTLSLRRGERLRAPRREVEALIAKGWVRITDE